MICVYIVFEITGKITTFKIHGDKNLQYKLINTIKKHKATIKLLKNTQTNQQHTDHIPLKYNQFDSL